MSVQSSVKQKAVVLLSAGLDSSVNLYKSLEEMEVVLALSFDYGQKAARQELDSAKKICRQLGVTHKIIDLQWFKDFGRSSLLNNSQIPTGASIQITNQEISEQTAKSVWVPNRNGIFLNIGAGFAEALDATYIIPGFNIEEAATFSDNTEGFLQALTKSFDFSTSNKVKAFCFTTGINKTEIVRLGDSLNVPWHLIWPCYFAGEKWCGQCESCQRAKRAFKEAQVDVEMLFNS